MEKHRNELNINNYLIPTLNLDYKQYFERARIFAYDNYAETINKIQHTQFDKLTLEQFLSEYIWCVYTSGFNAKIVSKIYDQLILVYQPLFNYAKLGDSDIVLNKTYGDMLGRAKERALEYCNNKRKVDAIFKMADILNSAGGEDSWESFKQLNLDTPDKLQQLPFIGPITKNHLARNIGLLDVVKEDLHLVRMAKHWGFNSGLELCKKIKEHCNLPLGIIDLILWYAASQFGTIEGNK